MSPDNPTYLLNFGLLIKERFDQPSEGQKWIDKAASKGSQEAQMMVQQVTAGGND